MSLTVEKSVCCYFFGIYLGLLLLVIVSKKNKNHGTYTLTSIVWIVFH